jgi:hypothetical protein
MGYFMQSLPLWAIFITILAMSLLAAEAGYRLAKWLNRGEKKEAEGDSSGSVAALFGLFAFILAFSFSITTNRFDARKQLVLQEANAISTTYLRARLLPQPQNAAIKSLLEEYLDVRLKGAADRAKALNALARSEEIHDLLWAQVESLVSADIDSEIRSLLISSMNEVIDLHEERKTVVFIYRIPPFIWFSLFLLMALAMFGTGMLTGAAGKQRTFALLLMITAFTLVIIMIAAMDRSDGTFVVSQQPLIDTLEMMRKGR